MLTREDLDAREDQFLATYAMRSRQTRGREFEEPISQYRTHFQRDRDRVIHCRAFRRLEYKTQVFVNHEGDHYRTRLTHTLEGTQIGRGVARALRLNEELTEALILAHDLGHTPFGHAGEGIMNEMMQPFGGFDHNAQSLRVVEVLERRYPGFDGLNLTYEVREGIIKHHTIYDSSEIPNRFRPKEFSFLEAQLANIADEIAYHNHDVDDGLASGLLSWDDMLQVALFEEAHAQAKKQHPNKSQDKLRPLTVSKMISILVNDLIGTTAQKLSEFGIDSVEKVREWKEPLVAFSPDVAKKKSELSKFLYDNLYHHYRVVRMEEKARKILGDLFSSYQKRPEQLPTEFRAQLKEETCAERVICDYLAGMTDRFAIDEHEKLFNPTTRV